MRKSGSFSGQRISDVMKSDFIALKGEMSVSEALDHIRLNTGDDQIVYYYVTDNDEVLKGIVPSRRLLTCTLEDKIRDVMIRKIQSVPAEATILDVWEIFLFHKFLALPVVDRDKRLVGVIDISLFTDNIVDVLEFNRTDEIFETIGFKLSQIRYASPFKVFRYRFPWLTATIMSGVVSAIMVSQYEFLIAQSIILAFFLTLVLGLGESVSMQSMTVTIQALRNLHPTMSWFLHALVKELKVAFLLGLGCGLLVFGAIFIWQGALVPAAVIGGSIVFSLTIACLIGLTIPAVLHISRLDLKIAAGPLTLALADIFTIIIYFGIAALFLG